MKIFLTSITQFAQRKKFLSALIVVALVIATLNLGGYISGPIPMMCLQSFFGGGKPAFPGDLSNDVFGPGPVHCYSPLHKEFWDITKVFNLRLFWSLDNKQRINIHLSYPTDFSNNQNLIGGASNVFVAKVIAQTGNKETTVGPRTQYTVEIVQNIKGDLSGIVTLDQLGGYKNGQLVTVEDSTLEGYLLQPGSTYFLTTRYNEKENWYTLNPHPNASKLLSSDSVKSDADLKALSDQDEKVKSLEAAYPDEVLLDADIAHQNTRNEFKSLPADKKAAAQSRADSARASLAATAQAQ